KLSERGKKLIMPAEPRRGHKTPHRKRIHQPVVQVLIRGAQLARQLLCWNQLTAARRLRELQPHWIHAYPILPSVPNKRLGIHRTREVHVQVRPLGKLLEKGL